jgi:hypothetical protein
MPTTTTNPYPDVSLPAGALEADAWQAHERMAYRVVFGNYRAVTDSSTCVSTSAIQWSDGSLDDGLVESPRLVILGDGEGDPLNSDQARQMAAVLLDAAAELDRWAGR